MTNVYDGMTTTPDFATALKAARAWAGLTQKQLAAVVRLSLPAIEKYEQGRRTADEHTADDIANALDLPHDLRDALVAAAQPAPSEPIDVQAVMRRLDEMEERIVDLTERLTALMDAGTEPTTPKRRAKR